VRTFDQSPTLTPNPNPTPYSLTLNSNPFDESLRISEYLFSYLTSFQTFQVAALFDHWDTKSEVEGGGFEAHVSSVCSFYQSQRDAFLSAADAHLQGLAEWNR
jgi:hypothetical protein